MRRPRFIVASVTGYDGMEGSHTARPRTDYMVLDTLNAHREVASFPSRGHSHRSDHRRERAERLAANLNRGDQEWRDSLAREAELTA